MKKKIVKKLELIELLKGEHGFEIGDELKLDETKYIFVGEPHCEFWQNVEKDKDGKICLGKKHKTYMYNDDIMKIIEKFCDNRDFEIHNNSVPFMKALEAIKKGETIFCIYNSIDEHESYYGNFWIDANVPVDDMLYGAWFIEEYGIWQ